MKRRVVEERREEHGIIIYLSVIVCNGGDETKQTDLLVVTSLQQLKQPKMIGQIAPGVRLLIELVELLLPVDKGQFDPVTSETVVVVMLKFPGLGSIHPVTKIQKKKQKNKTNNNI